MFGRDPDIKTRLMRYIKTRPCLDCKGEFPPEVMEFDHRVPGLKYANVCDGKLSLKMFVEELEKCDVVCANCHKLRTYRRRVQVTG